MEDINMKKQYLFCCALLLSTSYAQYSCAMQGQRDLVAELRNPYAMQVINQADNALDEDKECSICFETMEFGDHSNPRARLECNHKFHRSCIEAASTSGQGCPTCRQPIDYQDDFLDNDDLVPAVRAQPVEPMQSVRPAQPARLVEPLQVALPVQVEQRVQLTQRQQDILQELIRGLSQLERDDIQVMLIDAYSNPLALANSDFMDVLTNEQRRLAQEFIDLALDPQAEQQPVRATQPALDAQEHELVAQLAQELAQELARLQRDDIDIVLIEAYTNPYVLAHSPALITMLNNEQKALVDYLLARYTQRITQAE